ncbi:hypothetical protein HRbin10_02114 [bacterium HR10]|nr:hypothetical protein HRbin10_02114 [bacterium HR10]
MKLVELAEPVSGGQKAEEFLRAWGLLKTFTACPYCGRGPFRCGAISTINAFWDARSPATGMQSAS